MKAQRGADRPARQAVSADWSPATSVLPYSKIWARVMGVGGFPVRFQRVPFVARMPSGFTNPCRKFLRVLVAVRGLSRRVVCRSDPCRPVGFPVRDYPPSVN